MPDAFKDILDRFGSVTSEEGVLLKLCCDVVLYSIDLNTPEQKKALTAQYRTAQKEMREIVTVKGNIDYLLNFTGGRADKEQAR